MAAPPRVQKCFQAVAAQDQIGLLAGSVTAAQTHRDANLRRSEGGGVIDTITDHSNVPARLHHAGHQLVHVALQRF